MALDIFLVLKPKSGLPNFKAETADVTFSKYVSIPVVHFALGYSDPTSVSGAGAGKLAFQTLNLILNSVSNSPGFLTMAAQGQTFDSVTMYVRNTSGTTSHVTSIYHFGTVVVSAAALDGNTGDNTPSVNLSLTFAQFSHHGSTTANTGAVTPGLIGSWNIITNTPWSAEPVLDGPGWV